MREKANQRLRYAMAGDKTSTSGSFGDRSTFEKSGPVVERRRVWLFL